MESVPGRSLADLLAEQGPVPPVRGNRRAAAALGAPAGFTLKDRVCRT